MTVVWLIALIRFYKKTKLNIVIMGASGKVEERIFRRTNYYEEISNFYPDMDLTLYFVGPELDEKAHGTTEEKNNRLRGKFFRGFTHEFLESLVDKPTGDMASDNAQILTKLPVPETICIGYNPGFGSGYEPLLKSWCDDITLLANLGLIVIFTQANDFSDLKGEQRVMQVVFETKLKPIIQPTENPFKAVTRYTDRDPGPGKSVWCCANVHCYGFMGWMGEKLTLEKVRSNITSDKGKALLTELQIYVN